MTPYYQDAGLTAYVSDAVALCELYAGQAQLLVTSPPYNVSKDYGDGALDRLPIADYLALMGTWMQACATALRPGGVLALNVPFDINLTPTKRGKFKRATSRQNRAGTTGVHHGLPTEGGWSTYPIASWCEVQRMAVGLLPRRSVTWVKSARDGEAYATSLGMGVTSNPFMRAASERIVLASKDRYAHDGASGKPLSFDLADICKDVWHVSSASEDRVAWHPAPFPREIPRRLIRLFTEPGDLVLDPFGGSFTTACVARELARVCVTGDTNAEYVRLGVVRYQSGTRAAEQIRRGQAPMEFVA